jgi:amino-acid N-acetyltransferase
MLRLLNHFAAQNVMLPRTEASVRQSLDDWLLAAEDAPTTSTPAVLGCGAVLHLTPTLGELRSLAIHPSHQGQGVGSRLVHALVELARARAYHQLCALTLRPSFFTRLGFHIVDRWSLRPKVWQACLACPKLWHCDEVAVVLTLVDQPGVRPDRPPGWHALRPGAAGPPLRLAEQVAPSRCE